MKSWVCMSGLLLGTFFLQATFVSASASQMKIIVKAQNKSDLEAVEMAVHQQMEPGKHYEFVKKGDRDKVDANFATMQSLFDKYGSVDKMNESEKVQVFNAQESINSILTHNDGDRLVCQSVAPLGSHIPKTTCRTNRQIEQSRRDTDNLELRMQQVQNQRAPGH